MPKMLDPAHIFANWHGVINDDFCETIAQTFGLPVDDAYVYRADAFAMTMSQIRQQIESGRLKYKYSARGKQIEVSAIDITSYTSIFSPTTDTSKALTAYGANAKKGSPREMVAKYLVMQRQTQIKVPRCKNHVNPYYDLWAYVCQLTTFLGPLSDSLYGHPANSKITHPILPVFYHHFGCVVPSYEALHIIQSLGQGVVDVGSGNGYWTYMLRQMGLDVVAVDSIASEYRMMWISDTVKADGVEFVRKSGARILLMVYPVTAGFFTRQVLQAYKGDTIVIVGTQNSNRYTGFSDCTTEEYFEKDMSGWVLSCRISMPSFPGKDDAMFVWQRSCS